MSNTDGDSADLSAGTSREEHRERKERNFKRDFAMAMIREMPDGKLAELRERRSDDDAE